MFELSGSPPLFVEFILFFSHQSNSSKYHERTRMHIKTLLAELRGVLFSLATPFFATRKLVITCPYR